MPLIFRLFRAFDRMPENTRFVVIMLLIFVPCTAGALIRVFWSQAVGWSATLFPLLAMILLRRRYLRRG